MGTELFNNNFSREEKRRKAKAEQNREHEHSVKQNCDMPFLALLYHRYIVESIYFDAVLLLEDISDLILFKSQRNNRIDSS